jgi:hypothetical protein
MSKKELERNVCIQFLNSLADPRLELLRQPEPPLPDVILENSNTGIQIGVEITRSIQPIGKSKEISLFEQYGFQKRKKKSRSRDEILKGRTLVLSKVCIYILMGMVTAVLMYFMWYQYVTINEAWLKWVVFFILALVGLANWVFGFYFLKYAKKLIPKLQNTFYIWFTK